MLIEKDIIMLCVVTWHTSVTLILFSVALLPPPFPLPQICLWYCGLFPGSGDGDSGDHWHHSWGRGLPARENA